MSVDLTLPASSSPTIDPYKDLPDPLLPFAVFVHVELGDNSEEELARIEEACNSQTEGATSVLRAPRHDFAGQPLRAALTEHLDSLIATRRFDPFHFVAVVDKNWRETDLVIVTMDDGTGDEEEDGDRAYQIDQLRVPAQDVGLVLVNLQISNVDWADYKEEYGGDDDQGDDGDDDGNQDPSTETPEDDSINKPFDSSQTDEEYSDGASTTPRYLDYYIGFFAIPGIDFETVMWELHPCWGPRIPIPELGCRPQGHVTAGSTQAEAVAQAKRIWPLRCRNNPQLHRGMFLIVDTPDYHMEGVLLVKTDWEEKAEGADNPDKKSIAELAALGEAAATDTQRLPIASATTMTLFNEIKEGYRPWKHTQHTFLAYAGPRIKYPLEYLAAVDKSFQQRKSGSQRFLDKTVQHPP
ncbi:hypothetical protein PG984_012995 [Apiospora sp. TS-2023a]